MDAGTRIDIGGYSAANTDQKLDEQQFMLGDTRSLEQMIVDPYPEVVFDLSEKMGFEPCSVYRLRARALDKLTRLRYGAGANYN